MFKKILAGLGIDGAKVNFQLDNNVVELGGIVSGKVYVSGGAIDQVISEISIALEVSSRYKAGDDLRQVHQEIAGAIVASQLTIKANSPEISIPLEFKLPYNIPISTPSTRYQFRTNLDIPGAIDATDIDEIVIRPNHYVQCLLDALAFLGFRSKAESGSFNGRFQQFEYVPTQFLRGKLDELEVYFEAQEDSIHIVLQIDKKVRGFFASAIDDLDLDERHVSFYLTNDQLRASGQTAEILAEIIQQEYDKIGKY
ncbi:sporulation protein [Desulfosporosinus sp. HMP52]|uniref:sporulation protein n=1 Tax=Desulfosporosinus sp. HMP52 TaxID=1487923 RepID=UPI00051F9C4E|nr:sporulation protein [Desulfosporosinus sp. HMP52]KGK88393.1 sporulation protein [Desulfosporosinus sp. HMP52]